MLLSLLYFLFFWTLQKTQLHFLTNNSTIQATACAVCYTSYWRRPSHDKSCLIGLLCWILYNLHCPEKVRYPDGMWTQIRSYKYLVNLLLTAYRFLKKNIHYFIYISKIVIIDFQYSLIKKMKFNCDGFYQVSWKTLKLSYPQIRRRARDVRFALQMGQICEFLISVWLSKPKGTENWS